MNNGKQLEIFNTLPYNSVTESLQMFKDDDLVAEPNTKFNYTTHGWTLVSAIIEGCNEGKKFEDQIIEMTREIGMQNTFLDKNEPILSNRSRYYIRESGVLRNAPIVDNSYKWAGGGLLSDVHDLLIFAHCMLYCYQCNNGSKDSPCCHSARYLKSETIENVWKPVIKPKEDCKGHYAMGWYVLPTDNNSEWGPSEPWRRRGFMMHTGAAMGASSIITIVPSEGGQCPPRGICIAILANLSDCGGLQELAIDIAAIFRDYIGLNL